MSAIDPYSRPALLADADRCVLCGLCSAQCPTYGLYQTETEAPRGRIAMIQGLLRGQIHLDSAIDAHLAHCLGCRRCEAQCPSGVPYGRLIDGVKMHFAQPTEPRHAGLSLLTRSRGMRRLAGIALRVLPTYLLSRWARVLKAYQRPIPAATHANTGENSVALFTGCITELADNMAVHAAQRLLQGLGLKVLIPPSQHCCGALALHAGDKESWERAAEINGITFDGEIPVVGLTPGCTATLLGYRQVDDIRARTLAARVQDVGAYIVQHPRWSELQFAPRPWRVGIHLPCSQRNVLKDSKSTRMLLLRIPKITLFEMPELPACCGAAGTKMLDHRAQASALRAPLLDYIREQRLDCIVSTNIGCALHLLDGIQSEGLATRVMHPLTLLSETLAPGAQA